MIAVVQYVSTTDLVHTEGLKSQTICINAAGKKKTRDFLIPEKSLVFYDSSIFFGLSHVVYYLPLCHLRLLTGLELLIFLQRLGCSKTFHWCTRWQLAGITGFLTNWCRSIFSHLMIKLDWTKYDTISLGRFWKDVVEDFWSRLSGKIPDCCILGLIYLMFKWFITNQPQAVNMVSHRLTDWTIWGLSFCIIRTACRTL